MPGGAGKRYTYAQLEGLWINAGGPRSVAPVAAAIAEAESGGWSGAHNPSGASGLWQILGVPFKGDPFNAQTNARMAVAKYKGAGNKFTPWVTYTNGAYKRFLSNKTTPVGVQAGGGAAPSGGGGSTASDTAGGSNCLVGFGGQHIDLALGLGPTLPAVCFFRKSNARSLIGGMLMAAGGGTLVIGTAVLIAHAFSNSGAGRAAGRLAGTGLEIGGAAAAVMGAPEVGAPVAAAGSGLKRGSGKAGKYAQGKRKAKRTRQAGDERELMRTVGEPRENPRLETGGGTVRETAKDKAARQRRQAAAARSRARATANPPRTGKHRRDAEAVPF